MTRPDTVVPSMSVETGKFIACPILGHSTSAGSNILLSWCISEALFIGLIKVLRKFRF